MRLVLSSVLAAVAVLASCAWRETHARCDSSADCSTGQQCYRGYCVIGDAGSDLTATQSQPQRSSADAAPPQSPSDATTCQTSGVIDTAPEGACCVAAVSCYEGPIGTSGVGTCKAGMRACTDGKLGACSDSVVPQPESCSNQGSDDDCDGQLDNIKGVGETCTLMSGFGSCGQGQQQCMAGMDSLSCVRGGPTPDEVCNNQDEDCDGQIDEGFDFSSDRANCGACGKMCSSDQLCCAGSCIAMSAAAGSGCPSCSSQHPCADAASCCGGACRDFQHDRRHCGACGHSCEQGERCCDGACKTNCGP